MAVLSGLVVIVAVLPSGLVVAVAVAAVAAASSVTAIAVLLRNRPVIPELTTIMDIINRNILAIVRAIIWNIIAVTMAVVALLPNGRAVVPLDPLMVLWIHLLLS